VFTNLIDNAIRHCDGGDSVTIQFESEADGILVTISDTGSGIPDNELGHIFDAHFRASNSMNEKGTNSGLGLAISKRIIELHGSDLTAKSTLGQGSQFSFKLLD
jgi:signal transduction histidine kinase